MSNENDRIREDEVDLVDILRIIIKRRKIIIWSIVLAVILSGIYVVYPRKKPTYTTNMIIEPPQEYNIDGRNLLHPSAASELDLFLSKVKNQLNRHSYSYITEEKEREYHYTYSVNLDKDKAGNRQITISLTGKKEKALGAVQMLYAMYGDFKKKIERKNKYLVQIAEESLQNDLEKKSEMYNKLTKFLSEDKIIVLPQGSEDAILNTIRILVNDITDIKKTMKLNKSVELLEGGFFMVKKNETTHMESITNNDSEKIAYYIRPEKSKKRQLLPVILSGFLALFAGIFLAFVVEFFSREDVKQRLKEAGKKQT